MIGRIFNWLGGGFFRTIGRFIAFIVLGAIVSILISKSDFKITDLLGIETIKADTYVKGVDTPWKNGSGTLLPKNGPYHYDTKTSNSSGGANQAYQVSEFYLQSNEQVDITSIKGGSVEIPFYISATVVKGETSEIYVCDEYLQHGNMYTCNANMFSDVIGDYYAPKINVWTMIVYNNGYTDMCTIDISNNKIRCPIAQLPNNNKIWFIQVRTQVYYTDNYPSQYYFVGLGDKVNLFKNDFVSLEENQNQNTQDIINSQENQTQTIMDTNMTETNSTATSFFDNFSDTDHGGLSSIITAPLTVINSMLSNTCVAPSATWKGATITLPCGNMFWDRPGASDLRNLLNVFYGGFVCYYAIRRLFLLIENMKDPTHDNIEVAEL